jgi:ATP-dependent Clp protease adapter protein ClpS
MGTTTQLLHFFVTFLYSPIEEQAPPPLTTTDPALCPIASSESTLYSYQQRLSSFQRTNIMISTSRFSTLLCWALLSSLGFLISGTSGFSVVPVSRTLGGTLRSVASSPVTRLQMAAGPAVAEPETIEKEDIGTVEDQKTEKQEKVGGEAWEVRLWNDPFNKREFVARCLTTICGKSDGESFQIMMAAHKNGLGVIGRYAMEIAELYTASLKGEGLMVDMVQVDDE